MPRHLRPRRGGRPGRGPRGVRRGHCRAGVRAVPSDHGAHAALLPPGPTARRLGARRALGARHHPRSIGLQRRRRAGAHHGQGRRRREKPRPEAEAALHLRRPLVRGKDDDLPWAGGQVRGRWALCAGRDRLHQAGDAMRKSAARDAVLQGHRRGRRGHRAHRVLQGLHARVPRRGGARRRRHAAAGGCRGRRCRGPRQETRSRGWRGIPGRGFDLRGLERAHRRGAGGARITRGQVWRRRRCGQLQPQRHLLRAPGPARARRHLQQAQHGGLLRRG
mmetsp:Transcript_34353/g.108249  ORF Transcript_34353/g.108249 Transcript_34353/m.108249 type:complete len:277 (+) Transcript_34353:196-1026(+)